MGGTAHRRLFTQVNKAFMRFTIVVNNQRREPAQCSARARPPPATASTRAPSPPPARPQDSVAPASRSADVPLKQKKPRHRSQPQSQARPPQNVRPQQHAQKAPRPQQPRHPPPKTCSKPSAVPQPARAKRASRSPPHAPAATPAPSVALTASSSTSSHPHPPQPPPLPRPRPARREREDVALCPAPKRVPFPRRRSEVGPVPHCTRPFLRRSLRRVVGQRVHVLEGEESCGYDGVAVDSEVVGEAARRCRQHGEPQRVAKGTAQRHTRRHG